jgi:enterochelin esterase-like enzyme
MKPAVLLLALSFAQLSSAAEPEFPWRANAISPRIEALRKQVNRGDAQAAPRFWEEQKSQGTPLVEAIPGDASHVLLTFLFRAKSAQAVTLDAQLTTTRTEVLALTRLLETDVWYKTFWIRGDLRFSYGLQANPPEGNSGKDPLNPKAQPAGVGIGPSFVELPAAPPQTWIEPRPGVAKGTLVEERIQSQLLKTERTAWIYTPAGYDAKRTTPYPVVICFDGSLYASPAIPTPVMLDNLIAAGAVPPVLAIFIAQSPQPQRNLELSNNAPFADFVAIELLPQIRRKWRVTAEPSQTVVCGSSAGGLAALYFAFHRPDVFGNVLAQSAALWPGQERDKPEHEWLTRQYESSPRLPLQIVLQPGVLEVVQTPLNGPSILKSNRHIRDVLTAKGYRLYYTEVPGGHEPLTWRGGIAPGLIQLMGR